MTTAAAVKSYCLILLEKVNMALKVKQDSTLYHVFIATSRRLALGEGRDNGPKIVLRVGRCAIPDPRRLAFRR